MATDEEIAAFEGVSLTPEPSDEPEPAAPPPEQVQEATPAAAPVAPLPQTQVAAAPLPTDRDALIDRFIGTDLEVDQLTAMGIDSQIAIDIVDLRGSMTEEEIANVIEEEQAAIDAVAEGKSPTAAVEALRLEKAGVKPPTPKEIFDAAKEAGDIPPDAIFVLLPDGTAGYEFTDPAIVPRTPEQQFAQAKVDGLIPSDATFVLLPDGTSGYEVIEELPPSVEVSDVITDSPTTFFPDPFPDVVPTTFWPDPFPDVARSDLPARTTPGVDAAPQIISFDPRQSRAGQQFAAAKAFQLAEEQYAEDVERFNKEVDLISNDVDVIEGDIEALNILTDEKIPEGSPEFIIC